MLKIIKDKQEPKSNNFKGDNPLDDETQYNIEVCWFTS